MGLFRALGGALGQTVAAPFKVLDGAVKNPSNIVEDTAEALGDIFDALMDDDD